jgi:hypothetical protein
LTPRRPSEEAVEAGTRLREDVKLSADLKTRLRRLTAQVSGRTAPQE